MLKHARKLEVERGFHNLTEDGYEKLPGNHYNWWNMDSIPYKADSKAMMSLCFPMHRKPVQ